MKIKNKSLFVVALIAFLSLGSAQDLTSRSEDNPDKSSANKVKIPVTKGSKVRLKVYNRDRSNKQVTFCHGEVCIRFKAKRGSSVKRFKSTSDKLEIDVQYKDKNGEWINYALKVRKYKKSKKYKISDPKKRVFIFVSWK